MRTQRLSLTPSVKRPKNYTLAKNSEALGPSYLLWYIGK